MSAALSIAQHFVARGLLVVAIWGLRLVIPRLGSKGSEGEKKRPRHHFLTDFKPDNPAWLVELLAANAVQAPCLQRPEINTGDLQGLVEKPAGELKAELFLLDPKVTYLNHGSYGACFRQAMVAQHTYQELLEKQPVAFMEIVSIPALLAAVADVADLLRLDRNDVVPLVNATTAVSTVVQSLKLKAGDVILICNTTYPAVRSIVQREALWVGARVLQVQLGEDELADDSALMETFRAAVATAGRRLRLAVLDHVVSFPPVVLPVKDIVALCKETPGTRVLVDGAHAVGSLLDPSITSLGADYYTANLHKWLCTPKGAALLWAAPVVQHDLRPLVTSHGCGLGFQAEFLWQGTMDWTAWHAVPASLAVFRALGWERVIARNHRLARDATALLMSRWGTSRQLGLHPSGRTASMVAVELPGGLQGVTATRQGAVLLHDLLRERFGVEVPVACMNGVLWVRISAQLYNSLHDYQVLAEAVEQLREAKPGPGQ